MLLLKQINYVGWQNKYNKLDNWYHLRSVSFIYLLWINNMMDFEKIDFDAQCNTVSPSQAAFGDPFLSYIKMTGKLTFELVLRTFRNNEILFKK